MRKVRNSSRLRQRVKATTSTVLSTLIAMKDRTSLRVMERIASFPRKPIAHAVNRLDEARRARVSLDLGAQVLDVQVDRALVAFVADALDNVEQVEPREHAARRAHQGRQQVEFRRREVHVALVHLDGAAASVQR